MGGRGSGIARGPAWAAEDDAIIIARAREGMPRARIAEILGRSIGAVMSRLSWLRSRGVDVPSRRHAGRPRHEPNTAGAPKQPAAMPQQPAAAPRRERKCLCCHKLFLSAGAHNRLCRNCRTQHDAGCFDTPHTLRYR